VRRAQEAVKRGGVKVLGGCFGCQARRARAPPCARAHPPQVVARALGGRVGRNPSGRFVAGTERLELTKALASRRDFARARVRRPRARARAAHLG